jgi:hypothetical protein
MVVSAIWRSKVVTLLRPTSRVRRPSRIYLLWTMLTMMLRRDYLKLCKAMRNERNCNCNDSNRHLVLPVSVQKKWSHNKHSRTKVKVRWWVQCLKNRTINQICWILKIFHQFLLKKYGNNEKKTLNYEQNKNRIPF